RDGRERQRQGGREQRGLHDLHARFSLLLAFSLLAPLVLRRAGRRARERNIGSVPVHKSRATCLVWLDQECGRVPRKCRLSPGPSTISSPSRRCVTEPSSI